ncbi:MAG: Rieske 2Fe-2S domain-containing protein [Paracoccaceae bacterium]
MTTDWCAAGLADDVPPKVVIAAQCNGVELAVWRSASGKLSAWKDRCPHRGMRLSHGFVRGETLSCIYHGWVYGTSGACQHIPAHPDLTPPNAIRAEAYDCVEEGGVLWLAPAGTASAPPDLKGLIPVRSMVVNASAAQIAAATGLQGGDSLRGIVAIGDKPVEVCLLLQTRAGDVAVHALCADGTNRVEVSRWLEDLRRIAEERAAA